MAFDPAREKALRDEREKMSPEARKIQALEIVADNVRGIHSELHTLNLRLQGIANLMGKGKPLG